MIDIKALSQEQLYTPSVQEHVFQEGEAIIQGLENRSARIMSIALEEKLSLRNKLRITPEEQKYRDLIARLRFIALPVADNESEVLEIMEKYMRAPLMTEDVMLTQRVRAYMVGLPLGARNPLKQKMRNALLRNKEVLTAQSLMKDGEICAGTIEHWLRDYGASIRGGSTEENMRLKKARYVTNSTNIQRITELEKTYVVRLVNLYELLGLSSFSPQGMEETMDVLDNDGKFKTINRITGLMEEVRFTPTASRPAPLAAPVHLPVSPEVILQAYQLQEDRVSMSNESPQQLTAMLREIVVAPTAENIKNILPIIFALAQRGTLPALLQERVFYHIVRTQLQQFHKSSALKDFELAPTSAYFVSIFLQYLLHDILKMRPQDSAIVGAHLGNILKSSTRNVSYVKLAYFDQQSQQFHWTDSLTNS